MPCSTCHSTLRNLLSHVRRFHPNINEDQNPSLNKSFTESSEEGDITVNEFDVIKLDEQKAYPESRSTCTMKEQLKIHTHEDSDMKEFPSNIIKIEEIATEEISENNTSESNQFTAEDTIILQDENYQKVKNVINSYTVIMLDIALTQQRSLDFIKQNTSHISKILEIIEYLENGLTSSQIYQARELRNKTYNCQICDKMFKNSMSLASHKYRYHRDI